MVVYKWCQHTSENLRFAYADACASRISSSTTVRPRSDRDIVDAGSVLDDIRRPS